MVEGGEETKNIYGRQREQTQPTSTVKMAGVNGPVKSVNGMNYKGEEVRERREELTVERSTDLLHQSLQGFAIFPQAALHPADHLGVQLAVTRQGQVILQHHLQL